MYRGLTRRLWHVCLPMAALGRLVEVGVLANTVFCLVRAQCVVEPMHLRVRGVVVVVVVVVVVAAAAAAVVVLLLLSWSARQLYGAPLVGFDELRVPRGNARDEAPRGNAGMWQPMDVPGARSTPWA